MINRESDDFYKLWLAIANIPNEQKIFLKSKFKTEKEIYKFYSSFKEENTSYKYTNKILSVNKEDVYKLIKNLESNSISFITYQDSNYIHDLEETFNPPYIIFYKGNLEKFLKQIRISIVGSRKPTTYGIQITELIVLELVKNNIATVSGGAYGIDTLTHKCTLNSNGSTCAVLGCGINIVYPRTNKKLFSDILDNGVIISEFLPDTPPYAYNFPRRNRIISALGDSLIVTEATEKSGSLITAGYSLELNKEIICIPGNPLIQNSKGCNQLIRDGASILTEIKDLYYLLKINEKDDSGKKYIGDKAKILSIIGKTPVHINEVIQKSDIDINLIYGILFELQLEKAVISLSGNYFARIS